MKSVLFVSNGHGEDTIATGVIRCLQSACPGLPVLALPLVGQGHAYQQAGIGLVGPSQLLPSGGLIHAGLQNLWSDLQSGLVRLTWQQIGALRHLRHQVQGVVAVGDVFPVILAGLFCRRPLLFIGTARSNWFVPYSSLEVMLFRWLCAHVWARDEPTARTLCQSRVSASWVGNAMMDCLDGRDAVWMAPGGGRTIAILPGSRHATYTDFPVLLDAAAQLGGEYGFVAALATSIPLGELRRILAECGWSWVEATESASADGSEARPADSGAPALRREGEGGEGTVAARVERNGCVVWLTRGALGSVLERCVLVLGQAGTANEQAAGLGRPVIAFDSDGRNRPGWYRARQKGLLGDALRLVSRDAGEVARVAREILQTPNLYAHMRQTGLERMGPGGASEAMARQILEYVERQQG